MSNQTDTLHILNDATLAELNFPLEKVINVVEEAFLSLHHPDSANPLKVIMEPQDKRSIAYSMAGRDAGSNSVGFKVVYEFDPDRTRNNYQFYSFIFICDDASGRPIALLDVKQMGPLRTSATSALFARAAHPLANTALVLGTGVQGQIAAPMLLSAMPKLERIIIHGSYRQGIEAAQKKLHQYFPDTNLEVSQDLETSVGEADIILAVTGLSAKEVIEHKWLKPGAVVVLVGYGIDKDVLHKADRLITTDEDQMKVTGDDLVNDDGKLPPVDATLSRILTGEQAARTHNDEIIFAYNSGMVVTDIALGRALADQAIGENLGQAVKLW